MPQRRPRIRQERSVDRRVVILALFGIAVLTALVIVAWKFGGGDSTTGDAGGRRRSRSPRRRRGSASSGSGKGTYLEIRRGSKVGQVVFQGTLRPGDKQFIVGSRFWLAVRRPSGVRFTLAGKPVALPAHRNLRVVVTPSKTDRVTG